MADITEWDVENEEFWESTGKQVASRNLWISIPSLLCGFAVWLYWSIITVQMLNLGFPFTSAELFTITAIAGFTGATFRIPNSFFIRIAGGRYTIFLTTAMLIIPAAGTGFALLDQDTPLWVFQMLAFMSGFGGGNFASSMSNISFFYPKKMQGLALGLNAGIGNAGVTTMQLLIPLVMTRAVFGGTPMVLEQTSGTLIGKIEAGTDTYIHNAGFVWLVFLIPLVVSGVVPDEQHPHRSRVAEHRWRRVVVRQDPRDDPRCRTAGRDRAVHHPSRSDRPRRPVVGEVAGDRLRALVHRVLAQADPW